ncbi:multidrug efflux pump subunit AcrA (membrane-fusion protein) [Rhizobium sp. SLBN-94]|jgi:hemolysin D|nr:multidrug efflux pump subunit AcrA (membrane-fusion protein) [Rhizobium sp. SLBN-94]
MAFILFIVGLAISVLAWTWLGKFDIVATAQGKIQPAGRVKVIQSAVLAKVVSPPVANGQVIKAAMFFWSSTPLKRVRRKPP